MIRIEEQDRHSRECNACGSEKDLKRIIHGRNEMSTCSLALCADCRETLYNEIERTRADCYRKCDGCQKMTHVDDLSSCSGSWDRHNVDPSFVDQLCGDDTGIFYCDNCLNGRGMCNMCQHLLETYPRND